MIVIGPLAKLLRWMKNVLYPVDQYWAFKSINAQQPFYAQHIGSSQCGQPLQPLLDQEPGHGYIKDYRCRLNIPAMIMQVAVRIVGNMIRLVLQVCKRFQCGHGKIKIRINRISTRFNYAYSWIERFHCHAGGMCSRFRHIGFADQHTVCHRNLATSFIKALKRAYTVDAVNDCYNCVQRKSHRARFSTECRQTTVVDSTQQIVQRVFQITAYRTTQATVVHQYHLIDGTLYQQMIEPDFAKLIHNDGCISQTRITQQAVKQGGFPTAQKSGENRYWNSIVSHSLSIAASRQTVYAIGSIPR